MMYVPTRLLCPGMILAKDAPSGTLFLSLITAGQPLTDSVIRRLVACGIQGIYVQSTISSEEPEEFIDSQKKRQMLLDIKKMCMQYSSPKANISEIHKSVTKVASDLVSCVLSKDELLINVIDIRDYDNYTYSHSMYVGILAVLIGSQLKLPKLSLTDLATAGLMHDIGKLDIPIGIVNKPGRLTEDEFTQMKTHPSNARLRLRENPSFSLATLLAVESHHEKLDGTGYPLGLAGDNIPLYGRILALADVYDALTSNRPYRRGWSSAEAIEYMISCGGTHFDCDLLQAFLDVVTAYPVGSVLRLSNGWAAIVIENTKGRALRPKVRIALPPDERGREVDLFSDRDFLSVTVERTLEECDSLPEGLL